MFFKVSANVSAIAVCLARGVRLALAPPVLASIYRDLSLLNHNLGNDGHDDESNLIVWAPFQLVQVWILERFRKISPNCVDSYGLRFARWENKKLRVESIGSFVDCGFDDFIWQPFGEDLNDKSGKGFYTRLVKDVKVYIPSGLFEPYVTVRYLEWWNKSTGECSLQSPIDDNKTDKFGKDESSIEGSKDSMDVDYYRFE
ncbi:aminotransferase-like mobile domain-containing protein [Tanacetum coccineum]